MKKRIVPILLMAILLGLCCVSGSNAEAANSPHSEGSDHSLDESIDKMMNLEMRGIKTVSFAPRKETGLTIANHDLKNTESLSAKDLSQASFGNLLHLGTEGTQAPEVDRASGGAITNSLLPSSAHTAASEATEDAPHDSGIGLIADHISIGGNTQPEVPSETQAQTEAGSGEPQQSSGIGALVAPSGSSGNSVQPGSSPTEPETTAETGTASDMEPVQLTIVINGVDWNDSDALRLYSDGNNIIEWSSAERVERFFAQVVGTDGVSVVITADTTRMEFDGELLDKGKQYYVVVGYQPIGGTLEDALYSGVLATCE